jgi:hypothetical protein
MRTALVLALAIALGATVQAMTTPVGGWLQSFVVGSGIRWQDAYAALESAESLGAGSSRERERMLLANAMAEGEAPRGLDASERRHRPGTLALLRYEAFDARGERVDAWNVRALVPPLPWMVGENGERLEENCPGPCREALAKRGGVLLPGSGEPGIAAEWVLRMPLGERFDLGARSLDTHDVFSQEPHRTAIESRRAGDRDEPFPANLRVTLGEACPAKVRVGAVARLRFYEFAIIPIPRGFEVDRWLQMNGCDELARGFPD